MVTDRIRLERLLGEGGMGSVWIAEHLTLGTRVAVKFVTPELAVSHPELHQRFLREAAAAAKISSPHVVRTFDFGTMGDGTPFLVMELLEGESLSDRLQREGALPPVEAAHVIAQVAKALAEAHRMNVVHRDIKPGNVFLTRAGRETFAKVLDFGIAKDVETVQGTSTKTGFMLGTPQYMSPEQLMSAKGVDSFADLWALAVTAYEAVTGKPPFTGETVPRLIVSIHGGQFDAPSSLRKPPVVDDQPALDAFFKRAFHADKDRRYATALDLADAFTIACGSKAAAASTAAPGKTVYGAPMESDSATVLPVSGAPPISTRPMPATDPGAPIETTETKASPGGPAAGTTVFGEPASAPASTPPPKHDRTEPGNVKPVAKPIAPPPAPARSSEASGGNRNLFIAGGVGAVAIGVIAFAMSSSSSSGVDTTAQASVNASAPAATSSAASAAGPSLATTTSASSDVAQAGPVSVKVAEGVSEDANAFVTAFEARAIDRKEKSLAKAFAACREKDAFPCTEPQWNAACAARPDLATTSVWTASLEGSLGIVRGGESCASRKPASSGSGPYEVLCCSASVATSGEAEPFQRFTAARMAEYQAALNSRDADNVAQHYADTVTFFDAEKSRKSLKESAAGWFKTYPDVSQVYGRCKVTTQGKERWRAVCPTVIYRGGKIFGADQAVTWTAEPERKIVAVGESNVQKVE